MGRKTTPSSRRGRGKGSASDSTPSKGTTVTDQPSSHQEQTLIEPSSSNVDLSPTKIPTTTPDSPQKSSSPPKSTKTSSKQPKTVSHPPEIDDSVIKVPVPFQGEHETEAQQTVSQEMEVGSAKEQSEEEEEIETTGFKEGPPGEGVKRSGRFTRSSVRKIIDDTQEEQSAGSVQGTKRKRLPAKTSQGKSVESTPTGSTDLNSRVVLSGCCVEKGYFDIAALSEFKELLDYQGWLMLFDVCAANVSGVREFYVNVKQLPDMSIGSCVNGVDISLSVASLSSLLSIPRDGFDKYSSDWWPMLVGVTPEEIYAFMFGEKMPKKPGVFKSANLKEPVMLVLHSLCNKVLLPRAQGRGTVRIMELVLMYLIMKKVKINLPALMLAHIMNCYGSSHHSLPYGSFITHLLKSNNVSLSGSTVPVTVFTKAILKQKGLDISGDQLLFKIEEPVEEVKSPTKKKKKAEEPVDQALVLKRLEDQETLLKNIIGLIRELSSSIGSRFDNLEKKLAGSHDQEAPGTNTVAPKSPPEEEIDDAEEGDENEEPADDGDQDVEGEEEDENDED